MGLAVNFRIQSGSKDQADLMLPADKGESETSEEDSTGEDGNKFRHRTKESGHFPGKGPKEMVMKKTDEYLSRKEGKIDPT